MLFLLNFPLNFFPFIFNSTAFFRKLASRDQFVLDIIPSKSCCAKIATNAFDADCGQISYLLPSIFPVKSFGWWLNRQFLNMVSFSANIFHEISILVLNMMVRTMQLMLMMSFFGKCFLCSINFFLPFFEIWFCFLEMMFQTLLRVHVISYFSRFNHCFLLHCTLIIWQLNWQVLNVRSFNWSQSRFCSNFWSWRSK